MSLPKQTWGEGRTGRSVHALCPHTPPWALRSASSRLLGQAESLGLRQRRKRPRHVRIGQGRARPDTRQRLVITFPVACWGPEPQETHIRSDSAEKADPVKGELGLIRRTRCSQGQCPWEEAGVRWEAEIKTDALLLLFWTSSNSHEKGASRGTRHTVPGPEGGTA